MKINHACSSLPHRPARAGLAMGGVLVLLLAGCVSERAAPPPPRAAPRPAAVTFPAPPPPAPVTQAAVDWRDRPLTAGDWSYRTLASGSVARFSDGTGIGIVAIACNSGQRVVTLTRSASNPASASATSVPLTVVTTARTHPFNAAVSAESGQFGPALAISLNAGDTTLDDLAFSRGRFAIEASGQPTLILPAWEEVGRVVEDCR